MPYEGGREPVFFFFLRLRPEKPRPVMRLANQLPLEAGSGVASSTEKVYHGPDRAGGKGDQAGRTGDLGSLVFVSFFFVVS